MFPFKTVILAALAAISLVSSWQYHVRHLRRQEGARLQTENEDLRGEYNRRRREPISTGRLDPSALDITTEGSDSHGPTLVRITEAPRVLATDYRNDGQATPLAALQTLAWACDCADAGWVEKLIVFDPAARTKSAAYFASVPSQIRTQWPTIEAMAAALLISGSMESPFPTSAVLQHAGVEQIRADRVALLLPDTSRPRMEFINTAGKWSYVITEAEVDQYLKEVAQRTAKP